MGNSIEKRKLIQWETSMDQKVCAISKPIRHHEHQIFPSAPASVLRSSDQHRLWNPPEHTFMNPVCVFFFFLFMHFFSTERSPFYGLFLCFPCCTGD